MSKIAHYLQEHLAGEVMSSVDARKYFSTDSSIFAIPPAIIAYPKTENDVRKAARFSWQLAERGRVIPLIARGSGTDETGAAVGSGIILAYPAHMNRILELDPKSGTVTVEPGINFGKLQQTLRTHGRFIPAYPSTVEYSTVGGSVAKNVSGEKSVKYGTIGEYVRGLRVVLANGEVIETSRLSKRELNKKLGVANFEGEIYRALDSLIEENHDLIESMSRPTSRNNSGYNLRLVKEKDGSFDLTPLFVGSQGTLGLISEVSLSSEGHNPDTTLIMANFNDAKSLQDAVNALKAFKDIPSAIEVVNKGLIDSVNEINPNHLKDLLPQQTPEYVLFVEFDNPVRTQRKLAKRAQKLLEKLAASVQHEIDYEAQQKLWKIRQCSQFYVGHTDGFKKAVPLVNDSSVPTERLTDFIAGLDEIAKNIGFKNLAIWGHAGDGILHIQPHFNLTQVGDRQRAFRLMDDFYKLVIGLGGSISGARGDGRLKAPYLEQQYGSDVYALLQKLKQIFDPYGTLNPGVKFGTSVDDIKNGIRADFTFGHFYDHLPRS
jgi:FAD/FMN-containing dehydrogenase